MGKDITFKINEPWVSGGKITHTLPKEGISEITILHNEVAPGGGTYIANTFVEDIRLRINSKEFIVWDGQSGIAGQISMGIASLRNFYKQLHNIEMPDEHFIIELPDALPKNAEIQIIATMATMASMGITTSYTGTYDILYEIGDKIPTRQVLPYIAWNEWNFGATTGKRRAFLETLPYKLRYLLMITYDGTTLADDTFDSLLVEFPTKKVFEGKLPFAKIHHEKMSRVALHTGHYAFFFEGGVKVPSDSLMVEWIASGGTTNKVHYVVVCY